MIQALRQPGLPVVSEVEEKLSTGEGETSLRVCRGERSASSLDLTQQLLRLDGTSHQSAAAVAKCPRLGTL